VYLSCRFCNDSAMLKFLWFLSDIIISELHNITRFWEILSPDPITNPLPKPEPERRTLLQMSDDLRLSMIFLINTYHYVPQRYKKVLTRIIINYQLLLLSNSVASKSVIFTVCTLLRQTQNNFVTCQV